MGVDETTGQQTSFEAAGVFMTVQEIIDALSTMPRDAEPEIRFDGGLGACRSLGRGEVIEDDEQ